MTPERLDQIKDELNCLGCEELYTAFTAQTTDNALLRETVKSQDTELASLRAEVERLREALGMDKAFPITMVLQVLADAGDHLLDDHNHDGHGHERIRYCTKAAREMLAALQPKENPHE